MSTASKYGSILYGSTTSAHLVVIVVFSRLTTAFLAKADPKRVEDPEKTMESSAIRIPEINDKSFTAMEP